MHLECLQFMGHARDLYDGAIAHQRSGINLVFPSDSFAVRKALNSLMDGLAKQMELSEESRATIEIVLAEALNNVVEHAYGEQNIGVIEVSARAQGKQLWVQILDDGAAMPGNCLPPGSAHDLDSMQDDLPEGGFGWFLIRELTNDLQYKREGSQNCLTFFVPISDLQ